MLERLGVGAALCVLLLIACVAASPPAPATAIPHSPAQIGKPADARVVKGVGMAPLGPNSLYAEACEAAFSDALVDAVRKVTPVEVGRGTLLATSEAGTTLAESVHVFERGEVLDFGEPVWSIDWQPRAGLYPDVTVTVTLDVTVSKETRERDKEFLVRASLKGGRATYRSGENAVLTVETTKPAYLRIFNQTADGQVHQVFPNPYRKENRIEPGRPVTIPDSQDIFDLKVSTLEGRPHASESFVVVATKPDLPYWPEQNRPAGAAGTTAGQGVRDLVTWLGGIDPADRAIRIVQYTVHAK